MIVLPANGKYPTIRSPGLQVAVGALVIGHGGSGALAPKLLESACLWSGNSP